MAPIQLSASHADDAGKVFSRKLPAGMYLVTYHDAKQDRIVMHIYQGGAESVKRIRNQIKTYKAAVYERGQQLDAGVFAEA